MSTNDRAAELEAIAPLRVMLLTGGSDKPYALGLASALASAHVNLEFVGSDELDCPEIRSIPGLTFLNLRGDQREDAPFLTKVRRVVRYYVALLGHTALTRSSILHVLWNNKFEVLDRTLLMAYYRALGKQVVLTVHNVNTAARDGRDSRMNRASLRVQYRLSSHMFVHTDRMKAQLVADFRVPAQRVSVIPFGINDTIPKTDMTMSQARQQFGISDDERVLLFFGQIAPYKGLEYLVEAIAQLASRGQRVRVIIAGKVKRGSEEYWRRIEAQLGADQLAGQTITRIRFIPDPEVEPFFKAADVVVLPYVDIFQSGVPFLAFSFGLPVIATDVGSLREDVTEGTGLLCRPGDASDLAGAISRFCDRHAHWRSERVRARIRSLAEERHSWASVAHLTTDVYRTLPCTDAHRARSTAQMRQEREGPSACPE